MDDAKSLEVVYVVQITKRIKRATNKKMAEKLIRWKHYWIENVKLRKWRCFRFFDLNLPQPQSSFFFVLCFSCKFYRDAFFLAFFSRLENCLAFEIVSSWVIFFFYLPLKFMATIIMCNMSLRRLSHDTAQLIFSFSFTPN